MKIPWIKVVLVPAMLLACKPSYNQERQDFSEYKVPEAFGDYWYQGKAEITSYALQQARYGEIHDGHAVLIFVTEDFSRSKQVKLDNPKDAGSEAVKVMKLNFTKKFNTGIYPYSMMLSSFTPVYLRREPYTLKVTTSSQEWCGHAFTQINLVGDRYKVRKFSYFESEGDTERYLENSWLEDEIWNLIRLAPDMLPTGSFKMISGTFYDRLSHDGIQVVSATGSVEVQEKDLSVYTFAWEEPLREVKIAFRSAFPHEIEWWEETYRDGGQPDAPVLTTRATKSKRILLDYWTKNKGQHEHYRDSLNLP